MSTLKRELLGVLIAFPVTLTAAGPNLGQPLSHADLAAWDINVLPDGSGLPKGGGTAAQGASIYAQKCAACHGEQGKGGISDANLGTNLTGFAGSTITLDAGGKIITSGTVRNYALNGHDVAAKLSSLTS